MEGGEEGGVAVEVLSDRLRNTLIRDRICTGLSRTEEEGEGKVAYWTESGEEAEGEAWRRCLFCACCTNCRYVSSIPLNSSCKAAISDSSSEELAMAW